MVRKYAITEDEFQSIHIDPVDGHLKGFRDNGDPVDFGNAMGPAATDATVAGFLGGSGPSAVQLNTSMVINSASVALREAPFRGRLAPFHEAVANRATTPVSIMAVGDSQTEGYGASSPAGPWVRLLADALLAKYPIAGLPTQPFYHQPMNTGQPSYTPRVVVTPAGVSATDYAIDTTWGYGRFSGRFRTTVPTGVFTFTGTGADIYFVQFAGISKMLVSVDGGAAVTVDTTSTTYGIREKAAYKIRGLTSGAHTVTFKSDGTTTSLFPTGVASYDGDESKGFHVFNGGHSGWKAGDFASPGGDSLGMANRWPGGRVPNLITLGLGHNETIATTPATFKTNMNTLIDQLMTGLDPATPIVLVGWFEKLTTATATWPQYITVLYEIAAARSNVLVCDFSARWPKIGTTAFATAYYDSTHMSPTGHRLAAQVLADFLASY